MAKTVKGTNSLFSDFKPPKMKTSSNKNSEIEKNKESNTQQPEIDIDKHEAQNETEIKVEDKHEEVLIPIKSKEKPFDKTQNPISKGGRPRKYDTDAKSLKINISGDCYRFIKKNGWEYDGMNGFINHLIVEEMRRRGE